MKIIYFFLQMFTQVKPFTSTIKGKVTDKDTQKPLAFATVMLFNKFNKYDIRKKITDKDGNFVFQNIENGYYTIGSVGVKYKPLIIRWIKHDGMSEIAVDLPLVMHNFEKGWFHYAPKMKNIFEDKM